MLRYKYVYNVNINLTCTKCANNCKMLENGCFNKHIKAKERNIIFISNESVTNTK